MLKRRSPVLVDGGSCVRIDIRRNVPFGHPSDLSPDTSVFKADLRVALMAQRLRHVHIKLPTKRGRTDIGAVFDSEGGCGKRRA